MAGTVIERGLGLTFPQLLAASVGGLLIYAAIKQKNPVDIIKDALTQNQRLGEAAKAQEAQAQAAKTVPAPTPVPPAAQYKVKPA